MGIRYRLHRVFNLTEKTTKQHQTSMKQLLTQRYKLTHSQNKKLQLTSHKNPTALQLMVEETHMGMLKQENRKPLSIIQQLKAKHPHMRKHSSQFGIKARWNKSWTIGTM